MKNNGRKEHVMMSGIPSLIVMAALCAGCATPREQPITGVGLALGVEAQTLRIERVLADTPAARAGLSPGLVVQQIDGVATVGRRLEDCVAVLRGPAGTKVKLVLIETATSKTNTVELTRERIIGRSLLSGPLWLNFGSLG